MALVFWFVPGGSDLRDLACGWLPLNFRSLLGKYLAYSRKPPGSRSRLWLLQRLLYGETLEECCEHVHGVELNHEY